MKSNEYLNASKLGRKRYCDWNRLDESKEPIDPSKIRKTHKLQHKNNSTNFKILKIRKEREKIEINKYYNQFEPNPISCLKALASLSNYLKEHLKRMKYIKNDYNVNGSSRFYSSYMFMDFCYKSIKNCKLFYEW